MKLVFKSLVCMSFFGVSYAQESSPYPRTDHKPTKVDTHLQSLQITANAYKTLLEEYFAPEEIPEGLAESVEEIKSTYTFPSNLTQEEIYNKQIELEIFIQKPVQPSVLVEQFLFILAQLAKTDIEVYQARLVSKGKRSYRLIKLKSEQDIYGKALSYCHDKMVSMDYSAVLKELSIIENILLSLEFKPSDTSQFYYTFNYLKQFQANAHREILSGGLVFSKYKAY